MLTKELAVPLVLFTLSIALKTCSLVMLCSMQNTQPHKEASSDDDHAHEETGIIMASLRNKKKVRNLI